MENNTQNEPERIYLCDRQSGQPLIATLPFSTKKADTSKKGRIQRKEVKSCLSGSCHPGPKDVGGDEAVQSTTRLHLICVYLASLLEERYRKNHALTVYHWTRAAPRQDLKKRKKLQNLTTVLRLELVLRSDPKPTCFFCKIHQKNHALTVYH